MVQLLIPAAGIAQRRSDSFTYPKTDTYSNSNGHTQTDDYS